MLLIVYRDHEGLEDVTNLVERETGITVEVVHSKEGWLGVVPSQCRIHEKEEELGSPVYDTECIDKIIRNKLDALVRVLRRVVERYGDKLGIVVITNAPFLGEWAPANFYKGKVYAAWMNANLPQGGLEIRVYQALLLKLAIYHDPLTALSRLYTPFIDVRLLAEKLKVEEYLNGFLLEHIQY